MSAPRATSRHGISAQSTAVRVENLNKSFGNVAALQDLSLEVANSEMLVLVGPSGCGKTTCLRCLAGLERPTSGRILIGDRVVTAIEEGIFVPPESRQIGMVFQSYAVWPHMTVFENIAYPLRALGVARSAIKPRVESTLRLVHLEGLGERYSSQLSGGQQQRVALARSLVAEPTLLLFDEPLSNLDANLRTQMRVEIKELQKKLGFTGVYVTHDQAEALAIADRVAIMQGGRLRQIGTPREVYDYPANAFVAGFIGATNLLPGVVKESLPDAAIVELAGGFLLRIAGAPAVSAGVKIAVSVRPETVTLLSSAPDDDTGVWPAEVTLSTFVGDTLVYRLRLGPHVIEARSATHVIFDIGGSVFVKVDAERCRLLRN